MKKKFIKNTSKLLSAGIVLVIFVLSSCSKHYLCPAYGDNSKFSNDEDNIIYASLDYNADNAMFTNKSIVSSDTEVVPMYQ